MQGTRRGPSLERIKGRQSSYVHSLYGAHHFVHEKYFEPQRIPLLPSRTMTLRLIHTTSNNGHIPPALERYEIHLRGQGLSERSITESLQCIRRLERHAVYPCTHITSLQILRFIGSLDAAVTKNTYFGHLRRFYRWLAKSDDVPDPMDGLKCPRRPRSEPRPITTEQLTALLALPLRHTTRAMILLAAFAGLRVHEIAKIKGEDIDPVARTLWVVGKGGHRCQLPLHAAIAEMAETMPRRGYWFPARKPNVEGGLHVRREHVGQTLAAAMKRAGIADGTAHRLRHWYGTNLVLGGADLRTAQTLLRHVNLTSTAIYTQVADTRRVEAIDRLTTD